MNRPTITLCMIVKDEEHCIKRCLESMAPHIDRYDISDTGSTDKTKEIIKEFFDEKGIPGEVHEIPWQGFGKSNMPIAKVEKKNKWLRFRESILYMLEPKAAAM